MEADVDDGEDDVDQIGDDDVQIIMTMRRTMNGLPIPGTAPPWVDHDNEEDDGGGANSNGDFEQE